MAIVERPGEARSPGITYQQLLDADTHPVPDILREEAPGFLGDADISIRRYISREWHELEKERLWSRVWQFACREEHIPEVGDTRRVRHRRAVVSDRAIGARRDQGVPQRLPAPWSPAARLRRQLRHPAPVSVPRLRVELDGELDDVPGRWDFPHVRDDDFRLPEVKVGTGKGS